MLECLLWVLLVICCLAFLNSSKPIPKAENKPPSITKYRISGYIDIDECVYTETGDNDFSKAWKSKLVFTDGRKLTLWGLPDCQLEDGEHYFFDYDSKFNILRTYQ